jgi:hypothetical protein
MGVYYCLNPGCGKKFDSEAVRDAHERSCEVKKQKKSKGKDK